MNQDIAILVNGVSKAYRLYDRPQDRVKEALSLTKKSYHKNYYALDNISFDVKKGETVGIVGTNGSGKSTLLKIITRVVSPTSGNVLVKGKVSALLELGAGFNPEYTGIENIYLNGTMMGYDKQEMDRKLDDILKFADIGEFIRQPVKTYSSGMFARLAFAVAINVEPDILIVDEVLSVGDTRFQIKCMDRMKEMMDGGTTILFVSHDINAIRRFCGRAVWIVAGAIQMDGPVNAVADKYIDYLKCLDIGTTKQIVEVSVEDGISELPPFNDLLSKEYIAEIVNLRILNHEGQLVNKMQYNEAINVEVIYDVYEENLQNPVVGIALFAIDGDYICGLNTSLDHVTIPWKKGRNKFSLTYPHGLCVLGGEYYFDTTIRDQTATVNIDYKKEYKNVTVVGDYTAEGRLILPHIWGNSKQLL